MRIETFHTQRALKKNPPEPWAHSVGSADKATTCCGPKAEGRYTKHELCHVTLPTLLRKRTGDEGSRSLPLISFSKETEMCEGTDDLFGTPGAEPRLT